jgi:hypothetical protein
MEQNDAQTSGEGFAPTPIADILAPRAAEPAPAPSPEPTPEPKPEAKGEPPAQPQDDSPRTPDGRFAPKDAQAEAVPPTAKQDAQAPTTVPVAVVQEERKKRQALERELAEMRAKAAAPQAAPQPPAQPQVPLEDLMFSDPQRFVATLRQQQEEQLIQTRLATSEAIARQQPDYAAAEEALSEYYQQSPQAAAEVAHMLRTHAAPAMWAYEAGKALMKQKRWLPVVQQHDDPEAWINAEVERRVSERIAQAPAPAPSSAPLPQSLAAARSAGPRTLVPAFNGPTPISQILKRR